MIGITGAALVAATVADWPDQRWRSMPLNNPTDAYLDFVTRHGRLNLAAYEPIAYGGVPRSFATMSNAIACMHAHGVKVVANGEVRDAESFEKYRAAQLRKMKLS